MAGKSRFRKYLIKFLAIPILVMPSSVLLAKMGEQTKQNTSKSSEMVKEYYIKQQRSESKKNQSRFEAPEFKNNQNKLTAKERQCLILKQKNASKLHLGGNGPSLKGNNIRRDGSIMDYENNNCEQILNRKEASELEVLNDSVKQNRSSLGK